jgi:predicted nucleotidyltransferase
MLTENLKLQIIERIKSRNPYKAFIFGSQGCGTQTEESDIDLLVVLDKEGLPQTYREQSENYMEISRLLRDINKKVAIDIIVMTKAQWRAFVDTKSGFSREILNRGISLL